MSTHSRIRRGDMAADVLQRDFTQIHNRLFRDSRLSFKAKGIFGLISTHRDGFGVTPDWIASASTDGVSRVKSGLQELEKFGYLMRVQDRNDNGTMGPVMYCITDMPRSEPVDENHPPVPTSNDASESPDCASSQDAGETRRSEPVDENPPAVDPLAADRTPKKTTTKNTSFEKTEDGALRAEGASNVRRTPTSGSSAREVGGSAASGKTKPDPYRKAVKQVVAAYPAELRLPERPGPQLHIAIRKALEEGRTVQDLAARIQRRWYSHGWSEKAHQGAIRKPVGAAIGMVTNKCPERMCEDGTRIDNGFPCERCPEREADFRSSRRKPPAAPLEAPEPPAAPAMVPTPRVAPLQNCDDCDRAFRAPEPGLCHDCQTQAAYA